MSKKTDLQEYLDLCEDNKIHRDRYHNQDDPIISDAEYDRRFRKIEEFEALYPDMIIADSPTQQVGGKKTGTVNLDYSYNRDTWEPVIHHNGEIMSVSDYQKLDK